MSDEKQAVITKVEQTHPNAVHIEFTGGECDFVVDPADEHGVAQVVIHSNKLMNVVFKHTKIGGENE